jgi:hypothetical protein
MTRFSFFIAVIMLSFVASPLYAEEKNSAKETEKKAQSVVRVPEKNKAKDGPSGPVKEWIDAENAMIDKLSKAQKESIFILRNKYSVIRVINVVERDVGNAVKSCGKNNPDIKKQMDDRFTQWKNAVNPIIKTAQKQLDSDIDAQKIVAPKEFRSVMKLNDKAFEYGEKQIQKTPVTTKDACGDLLNSMNKTEDDMIKLLRQTLLPESVIKTRAKTEDKKQKAQTKPEEKKSE